MISQPVTAGRPPQARPSQLTWTQLGELGELVVIGFSLRATDPLDRMNGPSDVWDCFEVSTFNSRSIKHNMGT